MSRIRTNLITNRMANGAPTVSHGLIISGVTTVSTLSVGSTITYEDVTNVDSVGIVTARQGIHIDDSIVHIGDTNTKIRFPADDTITAETGGSERVRIANNGYVGIGTATPDSILNLFGTGSSAATRISIKDGGIANVVGRYGSLAFQADVDGTVNGSLINFAIDGSEKLRITSGGFIGAGTANPRRHFHIHNSASATVGFQMTNGNTGESNDSQGFQLKVGSDSHAEISQMENSDLRIFTNASERLRIAAGGNFGVNNTNPQRIFHLGNSGTAEANIRIEGGSDYAELRVKDSDNVFSIHTNIGGAGSVEKLKLAQSDATLNGTTDGVLNLNTTDSRGPFIRYQESGTTKCWVGSGQGLSLGTANDLGLRATTHIRMRSGAEEHAMLTDEGFFAAKGMAGNWVSNQSPASTQSHQFNNTGVSKWVCQFEQEHHAGFGVQILGNSTANSEAFVVYANSNNTTRFRVLWDGTVGSANNSYGGISDIKLKENIVDANSQWNDIKAVKVRNFNFKDTPDTKMLGVVAQEIETVSPKLVWEDREGLKGVSYSVLYMKAIKALQEAQTRIETLESKVAALEGS